MRTLHIITALAAWGALGLQLALSLAAAPEAGQSVAAAIWRFLGFFTVLTNLFVAIVATAAVLAPRQALASTRVRFAALIAILLVGIVYSLALRHIWNPQGWQAVADHALHDATPLLYLLAWLSGRHGALGWRDAPRALVFPAAYLAYALARGAVEGWYAYYFLNPAEQGWAQFLVSVAAILGGIMAAAWLVIALDKFLARMR
ncbi:Pr6Pr family membrane protein [Sphingopyxis sp. LARHCG72]